MLNSIELFLVVNFELIYRINCSFIYDLNALLFQKCLNNDELVPKYL